MITKADSAVRLRTGGLWGAAIKIRSRNNLRLLSAGGSLKRYREQKGMAAWSPGRECLADGPSKQRRSNHGVTAAPSGATLAIALSCSCRFFKRTQQLSHLQ